MKKRLFILMLVVALVLPGAMMASADDSDTLSFSLYQPHFGASQFGTPNWDNWVSIMENYLGVKLDIDFSELPYGDYLEKQQVYYASQDWADVFFVGTKSHANNLGDAGLLVNLLDYEALIPNYMAVTNQYVNRSTVLSAEGGMYLFDRADYSDGFGTQCTWVARVDLFEQAGIAIPTTFSELEAALLALKEFYPDSYPLYFHEAWWQWDGTVYASNRVQHGVYYNGTEYVFGPLSEESGPRYKRVTEFLADMYAAGVIDPEFLTQTSEQASAKLYDDTYMVYMLNYAASKTLNMTEGFNGEWAHINRVKTYEGEYAWKTQPQLEGYVLNSSNSSTGVVINAKLDEARRELIIKMIDFEYSDYLRRVENWGTEGVTWQYDSNGEPEWMPLVMDAYDEGGMLEAQALLQEHGAQISIAVRPGIGTTRTWDYVGVQRLSGETLCWHDGQFFQMNEQVFDGIYAGGIESVFPWWLIEQPKMTEDESDEYTEIITPIHTYIREETIKFVTGIRPMSEYDEFINSAKGMGNWQYALDFRNNKLN